MSAALTVEPAAPAPPALLRRTAAALLRVLRAAPGSRLLPPPVLPPIRSGAALRWRNWIFAAPGIARAHVEVFEQPGLFAVVHACILPDPATPAPIFGFDMVAGRAQATGMFLDVTPVVSAQHAPLLPDLLPLAMAPHAGLARPRPEWGDFFSADFLAVSPRGLAQATAAAALGVQALGNYLGAIRPLAACRDPAARAGQRRYLLGQRRNPHTARMLARHVGEAAARTAMETLLFPLPS